MKDTHLATLAGRDIDLRSASMGPPPASPDTVDVADLIRTVNRGWRAIALCAMLGAVAATAVMVIVPRRYTGSTSVVLKTAPEGGGSLLARLPGLGAIAGGMGLGGAVASPLETELKVLGSRAIAGRVVDSLLLQARVRDPRGQPLANFVAGYDLAPVFRARKYEFKRQGTGPQFDVTGADERFVVTAGTPSRTPVGTLQLVDAAKLPSEFTLQLRDREDAITWVTKRSSAVKEAGEVARVTFAGDDSLSAAMVPNAMLAVYLDRRRTTDRGVNQRRHEFLIAKADSLDRQIAQAAANLRAEQERTGVVDPVVVGRVSLERIAELRTNLTALQVEEGALRQLMSQVAAGTASARQLVAFPTFLKSPAINSLIAELSQVETQRLRLLEARLETDPEVEALTQSARNIEGQLMPIAASYAAAISRQRADIEREFGAAQVALTGLPRAAESSGMLQREVLQLAQISAGLEAQVVEARLATVGEGGDVRVLDTAVPPKKPAFPDPIFTYGAGIGGGLVAGVVLALILGSVGRWVRDPYEVERATGVPALRFDPAVPLLVNRQSALGSTIVVAPVDQGAAVAPVIKRLVDTAASRGMTATVLDLGSAVPADLETMVNKLEHEFGMVIVQLPGLESEAAAAALREGRPVLLVAPELRVHRTRLVGAIQMLRRLDVPVAGVVMNGRMAG